MGYLRDGLVKVFQQDFPCLFTARETAIANSSGKYVCCIDSHMIIGRDMFVDLVKFMESREGDNTLGFAHAPINWAHQHERNARHDRDMSINELGDWNTKYNHERTITWKGMPWICRRDWWPKINGYGALSQHKISWGGGDMHIGIKPWLLGFKNWAVPCNSAIHIGPFPGKNNGHKYRLYGNSGAYPHTFGFLVACYVLGGEAMIDRNKGILKERFGRYIDIDKWTPKAIELGEDEKTWLDNRKTTSFEQLLETKPWDIQ